MPTPGASLEQLERELRSVRRSVRHQRLGIAGMAVLLATLALGGSGQPERQFDELRVKRLLVVDDQGKLRISALTYPDGKAGVTWLDRNERLRMVAMTSPDGDASMSWLDIDGETRIAASTLPNGNASIAWLDRAGRTRIGASTLSNGDAGLLWFDTHERTRIKAATQAAGAITLPTIDQDGKP